MGSLILGTDGSDFDPLPREFDDPALCLWAWKASRDGSGPLPAILMPVSSIGDVVRLVELGDAGDAGEAGGAVYDWARGGHEVERRFDSVEAWLYTLAEALGDTSTFAFESEPEIVSVTFDGARYAELTRARGSAGGRVSLKKELLPKRWQRASATFAERHERRRPETSVAVWRTSEVAAATVSGVMLTLNLSDEGARALLVDGTAIVDCWCPARVPGSWLISYRNEHGRQPLFPFELDLARLEPAARSPARPETLAEALGSRRAEAEVQALRLRPFG